MNRSGAVRLDFREGLFLDGGDHHLEALSPRRIEHQKRKAAVAGDQAESFSWGGIGDSVNELGSSCRAAAARSPPQSSGEEAGVI